MTSKLQVTIPKAIADRYGIRPGAEIEWLAAGDAIRVVPHSPSRHGADRTRRLELFDRATARQHARQSTGKAETRVTGRGWRRDDLYQRGVPR